MTDSDYSNHNISGFVPALVINYLLDKLKRKEVRKLPEKQTFSSVIMFADISGFTNLSERLTKRGPEGPELLAFTLNRYMELLVNVISRSGGDIFKYAGDAMIIVWPPPINNDVDALTILCRQAIQSGLDIQNKLTDFKIIDDVKLSVKIGFGVGQITIVHVGGVFQRSEYLPVGSPLTQAFECEHLAPSGGYTIVSKQIWELCNSYFEFEQINDLHDYKGENSPFFYVHKVKKSVKMKADAFLIKNNMSYSDIEAIKSSLKCYIPAAVMPYIDLDQEKWSAELRRLTVLFVNLGVDLKKLQSQEGLETIQQIIETIQRCVYSNQGSLNKFLMDDKGSTLILVFVLPPMAHQDDPVRAVLTARSLIQKLKDIKCTCSIGITTGTVFAGVVGTSGNRREYSMLGDSVNISARLMGLACHDIEKKIMVDENTKKEAEHRINFRFVKKALVKGKSEELNVYEPIFHDNERDNSEESRIKTLINKIKTLSFEKKESGCILGEDYVSNIMNSSVLIERFCKDPSKNGIIIITGSYSIGKSSIIREILEKNQNHLDQQNNWKYHEKISIFLTTLNPIERTLYLNAYHKIFYEILTLLSIRLKLSIDNLLFKIFEQDSDFLDNLYLLQHIFGTELKISNLKQKNFTDSLMERKLLKKMLIKILKFYLEEHLIETQSMLESSRKSFNLQKTGFVAPVVFIMDDMQDYDQLSWELTLKIVSKIRKILLILSIRTKYIEMPPVFRKETKSVDNKSVSRKSLNKIQETLSKEELVEWGIAELCERSENSYFYKADLQGLSLEEIPSFLEGICSIKNIEIIEMANRNKGKTISFAKKSSSKEQLTNIFYRFIYDKSEGIPFRIYHLIENLIKDQYLTSSKEKNNFGMSERFVSMLELDEYLTLTTPLPNIRINNPLLDRIPCVSLLLMKTACVIGDFFDLQTLIRMCQFKPTFTKERLKITLNELEKSGFIEILDDQSYNLTYRFTNSFMRESIYQRMIYEQRRTLHRLVAEALQMVPISITNEKTQCKKMIYNLCLAENVDPLKSRLEGEEFSSKAKRSIIVKKISSIIGKNPNNRNVLIKKGFLEKRSDKGFKWSKRYCIINNKEFRYFYSEQDYHNNLDDALGTIPFKAIFQIITLKETESKGKSFAFVIYVGSWLKKNEDKGIREFYFSAETNDDLEQWTTYMEFMRAKAMYDSFVNTFGKISFPLNEKTDVEDGSQFGNNNLSHLKFIAMKSDKNLPKNSSVFRKTTFLKGLVKEKSKANMTSSTLALENTIESQNSHYYAECSKKLKERLLQFFHSTSFLFWGHIFERISLKKTIILGKNTSFIKEKNLHFFFDRTLFDDILSPEKEKSNLQVKFTKESIVSSVSFSSSDDKYDRNSVLSIPNNPLDNKALSLVNETIDEMKSTIGEHNNIMNNSRKESIRDLKEIREENEEFLSSPLNEQIKFQKKSILVNCLDECDEKQEGITKFEFSKRKFKEIGKSNDNNANFEVTTTRDIENYGKLTEQKHVQVIEENKEKNVEENLLISQRSSIMDYKSNKQESLNLKHKEITYDSIPELKNFLYGLCIIDSFPIEGDSFILKKDEIVIIAEIDFKKNIAHVIWKGFSGIFETKCLKISDKPFFSVKEVNPPILSISSTKEIEIKEVINKKPRKREFFSEKKQENSLFFKDYNTLREANIWSSGKSDKKQLKEEEYLSKNLNYSKITNISYKNYKKL